MDITDEKKRVEIFCCYARKDRDLLSELKSHLKLWERLQLITLWTDADIGPGMNWQKETFHHLSSADIILLLVSPDFLASEYCYSTEMAYAMKRYERGEARVIPIILRHCAWAEAPFGEIQALPTDAKPVISPRWHNSDEAFTDVARGIRQVVEVLRQPSPQKDMKDFLGVIGSEAPRPEVRSPDQSEGDVADVPSFPNLAAFLPTEEVPSPNQPPGPTRARTSKSVLPAAPQPAKRGISRRTAIFLGLAALGAGAAGAVRLALTSSPLLHVTPTPVIHPGTTLLTYVGHSYFISSVSWSPDGKYIASGSEDLTVQVWNSSTGMRILIYRGHSGNVITVAWSPDGKHIASGGSDHTAQVWDASTGRTVLTYRGHSNNVHSVAWSPNGQRIVSGSVDHTAQVWDASTGKKVFTYQGHSDTVYWVAWSPDGRYIASASADHTVQVWNASTGKNILTYRGHSDSVPAVAWSPDGKRIASAGGSRDKTVQVWNASTGGNAFTYRGHWSLVHSVAWSPDGKRIASASFDPDDTVQVWDASTGRTVLTYRGHSGNVFDAAWSPDGKRIASCSGDNTVQVWSAG